MKKKIFGCLCLCASTFLFGVVSSFAAAGDSSQASTTSGGLLTVGETAATQMTFSPSPNVLLAVKATTSAHSIMSTNGLTSITNGMEYGTTNSATGYAQRTKTVAENTAVPAPASATALATADGAKPWVWMGGSGS